jgi:hypothetical protein
LKLEFKLGRIDDNSGVLVRFSNPRLPVPDRNLPGVSHPYNNQAFVAVDTGFEIQIDEPAEEILTDSTSVARAQSMEFPSARIPDNRTTSAVPP